MTTLKEVENCKQTPAALAKLVRELGYRGVADQMYFNNGACASDLISFFEDNPGAIAAVLDWIADEGCHADGEPILDEECEDCEEDNDSGE